MCMAFPQFTHVLPGDRQELIRMRRHFHQYPELAFQEHNTAAFIADALRKYGYETACNLGGTGVAGALHTHRPGPVVLIRADMDALPIQEDTGLPYASQHAGVMHACGHDAHMAIGLTTAAILARQQNKFNGQVVMVFQPAEEIGQGARAMVADGLLERFGPDFALGIHVWNPLECGTVGIYAGPMMANVDNFTITIHGRGGHAAEPRRNIDPIAAAVDIAHTLQTIVPRKVTPLEPALLTVACIQGGNCHNITPNTARMKGTARSFSQQARDTIQQQVRAVCRHCAAAHGATCEVEYAYETDMLVNDPAITRRMCRSAAGVVGETNVLRDTRTLGGEDMAVYLARMRGAFMFIGSGNPAKGAEHPHHHPGFTIDEHCLPIGAEILVQTALALLQTA